MHLFLPSAQSVSREARHVQPFLTSKYDCSSVRQDVFNCFYNLDSLYPEKLVMCNQCCSERKDVRDNVYYLHRLIMQISYMWEQHLNRTNIQRSKEYNSFCVLKIRNTLRARCVHLVLPSEQLNCPHFVPPFLSSGHGKFLDSHGLFNSFYPLHRQKLPREATFVQAFLSSTKGNHIYETNI